MPAFFKKNLNKKISVFVWAVFLIFNFLPAKAEDAPIETVVDVAIDAPVDAAEIVPVSVVTEDSAPVFEISPTANPSDSVQLIILPSAESVPPASNENNPILIPILLPENIEPEIIEGDLIEISEEIIEGDLIETGEAAVQATGTEAFWVEDEGEDVPSTETQIPATATSHPMEIIGTKSVDADGNIERVTSGIVREIAVEQLAILANWQMIARKEGNSYVGVDDESSVGTQFLPSGIYAVDKNFAVCALIADKPENTAFVSAKISYPKNISIKNLNTESACGLQKDDLSLNRLNREEASMLVCDKIRNQNNNLINWNQDKVNGYTYAYEQVCGQAGILAQNGAAVYCSESALAYDDPAGEYGVAISAKNNLNQIGESNHSFKYLELTMFENDFTDVQYGPAALGEWQTLAGDMVWGNATAPTVRNIGNTPLTIKIKQNDFGFGKTSAIWNILYQARVGSAPFTEYSPEQTASINNSIGIGMMANLDFSVLVKQFPVVAGSPVWSGELYLLAEKADFAFCQ